MGLMFMVSFEGDRDSLSKAINDVVQSDLWPSVCRQSVHASWLGYVSLQERQTTAILAWLLDPSQGHGVGDFFLKRMIMEALRKGGFKDYSGEYEPHQLVQRAFGSACVDTEVFFLDESGGSRFIDLVIIDPANDLAIIVERKTGAREGYKQLESYRKWAHKKLQESGYYVLCIVSGYADWLPDNIELEGWVHLEDEWLFEASSYLRRTGASSPNLTKSLNDLWYNIFGEWSEEADDFHSGMDADCTRFCIEMSSQIKEISKAQLITKSGKVVRPTEINTSRMTNEIIPFLSEEDHDLCWFLFRYRYVLGSIMEYDELYNIERCITASFPGQCIFSYEAEQGQRVLNVGLCEIISKQRGRWWPVYIKFKEGGRKEGDQKSGDYNSFFVRRHRRVDDAHFNNASLNMRRKLAEKFPSAGLAETPITLLPASYCGSLAKAEEWAPSAIKLLMDLWKESIDLLDE